MRDVAGTTRRYTVRNDEGTAPNEQFHRIVPLLEPNTRADS